MAKRRPPKKTNYLARYLGVLLGLALIVLAAAAAYVWQYLQTPFPLRNGPQTFVLARGMGMAGLSEQLAAAGLVEQPQLLTLIARYRGDAGKIKAGTYEISQPLTPLQLLDKITSGDFAYATITLLEGWNWAQVRAALNQHPQLQHDSAALSDAEILRLLGATASHPEGLFFPDTYHFAKRSSDLALLKLAHKAMGEKLAQAWQARHPGMPLKTPYEALTLASIIEKETGAAQDRPMIASVFANRLRIGMRLQTDPTVIYGLGERFDGNLRKVDLQTDSPYNSYTRAGLPPTPIAMPGAAALQAAVQPASSKALYFVAKGDGRSYFSESLAQHNVAVRRYLLGKNNAGKE